MSGDQINVDYENLAELSTKLTLALDVIGRELEDSIVLSAHVGDGRLGGKVVSFGQSWNKHRFDIRDTLEWLRDSITNIQTQLEDVDTQLAAGLNGPGTGSGGNPHFTPEAV